MRRTEYVVGLLLLIPAVALGQDAVGVPERASLPPSYKVLRFDESYLYLSDPAKRTDILDSIKYIPLQAGDTSWYLTIGGELRERFEAMHNPDFGIDASHDSYWLQRITLFGDLHLGQRVRVFVEGISGLIGGEEQPASPPQDDPIDLQFAFIDVTPYLNGSERLDLRVGRFGMSLGSGRLVATRAAPNIPFKFDGFEALYQSSLWQATAFLTRPVKEEPEKFDSDDRSIAFWGAYLTHWFDSFRTVGADLYYLGIEREQGAYASGDGHEYRHSFGTRIFGETNGWDWNGEAVVQVGRFGHASILAWTASLDAGYTLETTLQPRLGLKVDVASGDTNKRDGRQGTFDALFFKSGYFNDASLVRPSNVIDVHPNLAANLTKSVSLNGGVDVFWRYSKDDAIYGPPGFVSIPALRSESAYVGTAVDVNLQWQVQRHVTVLASYVHFFTGSYVRSAGGGDVDYFSTTLSFVF
jgi:alginate export protein